MLLTLCYFQYISEVICASGNPSAADDFFSVCVCVTFVVKEIFSANKFITAKKKKKKDGLSKFPQ
jgi:hypothetical protein